MPCHLSIIGNRRRYSSRLSIPMFIETPCMKNFFLKSGSGRIIKSLSLAQLFDDSRQFPGNGRIKWKLFFFYLSVFIKITRAGQCSWGMIFLSRVYTEVKRTDQNEFKKAGTHPAQGMSIVPREGSLYHRNERNGKG